MASDPVDGNASLLSDSDYQEAIDSFWRDFQVESTSAPSVVSLSETDSPSSLSDSDESSDKTTKECSSLTHKRIREESAEDEERERAQKRLRLEALDPILEAFNRGDFQALSQLVRAACHENVRLTLSGAHHTHTHSPSHTHSETHTHSPTHAPAQQREARGAAAILLFYGLLHETFPDAMTKILEKRISSAAVCLCCQTHTHRHAHSEEDAQCAEYVYKMHGTRITSRPVEESFADLLDTFADGRALHTATNEEIAKHIARQMASIPPQSYVENDCSYILETSLSFDSENKIVKWSLDTLATDIR